jgi:hypothetical protein
MALSEIEQALGHFKASKPGEAIPMLEELANLVPTYVLAQGLSDDSKFAVAGS